MKKDKKDKEIIPISYEGIMWKEFSNGITDLMEGADLTDKSKKAFGMPYKIQFYRDNPFTADELKKFVEKTTKNNDVEFIVLNNKLVYDRKKCLVLSDGLKYQQKDELLKLLVK